MKKLYYCSFNVEQFGIIYIASFNKALVFLHTDIKALINYANAVKAELTEDYEYNETAVSQLKEYFSGKRKEFSLNIEFLTGTDFQKQVWKELSNISFGKTSTYKDIATKVQHEKAVRATGTAIGKNPLPVVIPCHRVISSNGGIGGFSLGLDKKKYLLNLENIKITGVM